MSRSYNGLIRQKEPAVPAHDALLPAARTASDYCAAFTAALCYEIGVFLLTALLMLLLLPRTTPAATGDAAGGPP